MGADVSLELGLAQLQFKLSEEPQLGSWTVHYIAGSTKDKTSFTVAEYTLPKFEVEVEGPKAILADSEVAEWRVCGRYTHGGSVKGTITANFTSKY